MVIMKQKQVPEKEESTATGERVVKKPQVQSTTSSESTTPKIWTDDMIIEESKGECLSCSRDCYCCGAPIRKALQLRRKNHE
jgi:hypothetical protein